MIWTKATQGITNNNKWTLVLSIFYVGYCKQSFATWVFSLEINVV